MTLFETLLEAALNDLFGGIQPQEQGPLAPLKDRIAAAVKAGKLKPALNNFESIYFLERQLGKITPQDRQMLLQNKAWFQNDVGEWVLDTRRVPGAIPAQAQAAALPAPYKTALVKLIASMKSGRINAVDEYSGSTAFTNYGISVEEADMLKKLGVYKKSPGGGGFQIDIRKLSEIRQQQKL